MSFNLHGLLPGPLASSSRWDTNKFALEADQLRFLFVLALSTLVRLPGQCPIITLSDVSRDNSCVGTPGATPSSRACLSTCNIFITLSRNPSVAQTCNENTYNAGMKCEQCIRYGGNVVLLAEEEGEGNGELKGMDFERILECEHIQLTYFSSYPSFFIFILFHTSISISALFFISSVFLSLRSFYLFE